MGGREVVSGPHDVRAQNTEKNCLSPFSFSRCRIATQSARRDKTVDAPACLFRFSTLLCGSPSVLIDQSGGMPGWFTG